MKYQPAMAKRESKPSEKMKALMKAGYQWRKNQWNNQLIMKTENNNGNQPKKQKRRRSINDEKSKKMWRKTIMAKKT